MSSQAPALDRKPALRQPFRLLASVLSLPYLLLRASTASFAVAAGLVQTFVFARVLTPEHFSVFILIGSFGMSLWLFDLGASKILFVRQRARHLGQAADGLDRLEAEEFIDREADVAHRMPRQVQRREAEEQREFHRLP